MKLLTPAVAAIAVAFVAVVVSAGAPGASSAAPALDSEERALVALINDYRADHGKAPLLVDTDLNESADWHSNDMGVNGYFQQIDSLGRNPGDRMCYFGYCYSTWKGENIGAGFATAQEMFHAWTLSPHHDANMLQDGYKVIGIGRVYVPGSIYGWYWTNDFAGYIASTSGLVATPAPTPPPGPDPDSGCTADADCDNWPDAVENALGTNPADACSNTTTRNDEHPDAWPPDVNDDRIVNSLDTSTFLPSLNSRQGQQSFKARLDLNVDGIINTSDLGRLVTVLNRAC